MAGLDFLPVAWREGLYCRKNISTTPTAIRVGSTNQEGRKWLMIFNRTDAKMVVGFDTDLAAKSGYPLVGGGQLVLPVGDRITVYGRSYTGSVQVNIIELA